MTLSLRESDRPVLVTGATGLLGPYLIDAAAELGLVRTTSLTGGDRPCDLTNHQSTRALIDNVRPGLVIHAAGLTDVDFCERNPGRAHDLNVATVTNIVDSLPRSTVLVLLSTDQVYPDTQGPHVEDSAAPVNSYGSSKLAGESIALQHAEALIVRTNFFGPSRVPNRQSLSDFVVQACRSNQPFELFTDVLFNPLHLSTLAAMVVAAVGAGLRGVFNVGAGTAMTKEEFGRAIAKHLGLSDTEARASLSTLKPNRAHRPTDLRMDVGRIESALHRRMPTLHQEIRKL